jgi:four helix bundle protein
MEPARHFTDLISWQLADELRVEIKRLAERPSLARDLKLRSQLVDASDSTCRNIAEGFGCETHREFARFLHIARRSLNEVQDCFRSALVAGYVSEGDLKASRALLRRIFPALASLIRYLNRNPNYRHRPKRPPSEK